MDDPMDDTEYYAYQQRISEASTEEEYDALEEELDALPQPDPSVVDLQNTLAQKRVIES